NDVQGAPLSPTVPSRRRKPRRLLLRGADAARVRAHLLGLGIGALDRRTRLDGVEPALHVREVVDALVLALVPRHKRIEPAVENPRNWMGCSPGWCAARYPSRTRDTPYAASF